MIHLLYTIMEDRTINYIWQNRLKEMPLDVQERVKRYHKVENKAQLVVGRLLLQTGMYRQGYTDFDLKTISYNSYNRPIWKKEVAFSIAHSAEVVACAITKTGRIGLDIEKRKPIDFRNFKHILNEEDVRKIRTARDPNTAFFEIWTIKEAITKAMGQGLAIEVKPIDIQRGRVFFEGVEWFCKPVFLREEFSTHLVSDKPVELKMEEINYSK